MSEVSKKQEDLTAEELAFLINGLHAPILALRPLKDRIISGLVDRAYVKVRASRDPDFVMLELTETGRTVVMRQELTED